MGPGKLVIDARCRDCLVKLSGSTGRDPLDEDSEDSAFLRWPWSLSAISYIDYVGGWRDGN